MKSTPTTSIALQEPDDRDSNIDHASTTAAEITGLLKSAEKLYSQSQATDRKLLYQRVELGRVLIQLKDAVGHGNFIKEFKKWSQEERIGFSLKTGQRAMAYAELEAGGKFVDTAKNDIVSNLADAERLRKAEAEAEKKKASDGEEEGHGDDPVTLKKNQIAPKAKALASTLIEQCRSYGSESRQGLLEEIIELLTEELEQCS